MTEIHALPVRTSARAITIQRWHNTNRQLIERVLAGLRALDRGNSCHVTDRIYSYAHAHQIMAGHAHHRGCPRYTRAANYTVDAR